MERKDERSVIAKATERRRKQRRSSSGRRLCKGHNVAEQRDMRRGNCMIRILSGGNQESTARVKSHAEGQEDGNEKEGAGRRRREYV